MDTKINDLIDNAFNNFLTTHHNFNLLLMDLQNIYYYLNNTPEKK